MFIETDKPYSGMKQNTRRRPEPDGPGRWFASYEDGGGGLKKIQVQGCTKLQNKHQDSIS